MMKKSLLLSVSVLVLGTIFSQDSLGSRADLMRQAELERQRVVQQADQDRQRVQALEAEHLRQLELIRQQEIAAQSRAQVAEEARQKLAQDLINQKLAQDADIRLLQQQLATERLAAEEKERARLAEANRLAVLHEEQIRRLAEQIRQAQEQTRLQQEAKDAALEARRLAENQVGVEREAKEAEAVARRLAENQIRVEREAKEAESTARRLAEDQVRLERQAKEAEATARRLAQDQTRQEREAKEAEVTAHRLAEDQARAERHAKEAEAVARRMAEDQVRAERQAKEAEALARRLAENQIRVEREAKEAEAKARRLAEDQVRAERQAKEVAQEQLRQAIILLEKQKNDAQEALRAQAEQYRLSQERQAQQQAELEKEKADRAKAEKAVLAERTEALNERIRAAVEKAKLERQMKEASEAEKLKKAIQEAEELAQKKQHERLSRESEASVLDAIQDAEDYLLSPQKETNLNHSQDLNQSQDSLPDLEEDEVELLQSVGSLAQSVDGLSNDPVDVAHLNLANMLAFAAHNVPEEKLRFEMVNAVIQSINDLDHDADAVELQFEDMPEHIVKSCNELLNALDKDQIRRLKGQLTTEKLMEKAGVEVEGHMPELEEALSDDDRLSESQGRLLDMDKVEVTKKLLLNMLQLAHNQLKFEGYSSEYKQLVLDDVIVLLDNLRHGQEATGIERFQQLPAMQAGLAELMTQLNDLNGHESQALFDNVNRAELSDAIRSSQDSEDEASDEEAFDYDGVTDDEEAGNDDEDVSEGK